MSGFVCECTNNKGKCKDLTKHLLSQFTCCIKDYGMCMGRLVLRIRLREELRIRE